MREAARDRARRARAAAGDGERAVQEKIAAMDPPDRAMAERLHALVRTAAPTLRPRTWYRMPAYADGDVVCYFRDARTFRTRYATLGFGDAARLNDGRRWSTDFALTQLTGAEEARIVALLMRATGASDRRPPGSEAATDRPEPPAPAATPPLRRR